VDELSDIIAALSHLRKPILRNRAQLDRFTGYPIIDRWFPFGGTGKPENVLPSAQPAQV
jgi:hypothetical protein